MRIRRTYIRRATRMRTLDWNAIFENHVETRRRLIGNLVFRHDTMEISKRVSLILWNTIYGACISVHVPNYIYIPILCEPWSCSLSNTAENTGKKSSKEKGLQRRTSIPCLHHQTRKSNRSTYADRKRPAAKRSLPPEGKFVLEIVVPRSVVVLEFFTH